MYIMGDYNLPHLQMLDETNLHDNGIGRRNASESLDIALGPSNACSSDNVDILENETGILKELTNNRQGPSYEEKMFDLKVNTSIPSAEYVNAFAFIDDSDDSVKDADYASESSVTVDSETSATEDSVENRKGSSKVRGKKRNLGPEKWKKNVAKKLRNVGEQYTNAKTKKDLPQGKLTTSL
ncbi:unnamed protein product [Acanthoscelides obtectus]|uniref:Uncharacterized protein n=1 Tax=Acanthoscelides obtectus TaxID=200917 RepID=A0A9P0KMY1_ACAOB|nr:unnamed protein product [Acanthoscelides obtectus]CAK1682094.1 hypothetical protein AOBTE_LOCUS33423 [Acanthoscelides obtectus]